MKRCFVNLPRTSKATIAIGVWSVTCLVCVPLIITSGHSADSVELGKVLRVVSEMDSEHRQQLVKQTEQFLELSADQKEQLRELHSALTEESSEGRARRQVAANYMEWLQKRSLEEYESLETLADYERMGAVRQILADLAEAESMPGDADTQPLRRREDWLLSARELERILRMLEIDLQLVPREQQILRRLDGPVRQFAVLTWAIRDADRGLDRALIRWPSPEQARRMVEELDSGGMRRALKSLSDDRLAVLFARQIAAAVTRILPSVMRQLAEMDQAEDLGRVSAEEPPLRNRGPRAGNSSSNGLNRRDPQSGRSREIARVLGIEELDVERLMRWFFLNSRRMSNTAGGFLPDAQRKP